MRESSLIGHTIEVYSLFAQNPRVPADSVIRTFFAQRKYLGSKDRRFIADTYFGAIRNYRRIQLNTELAGSSGPAASIAAYLILFENADPTLLAKSYDEILLLKNKPPKEAFLSYADPNKEMGAKEGFEPVHRLAVNFSFPDWVVEKLIEGYGDEATRSLLEAMNESAPTTLRANTLKVNSREELKLRLANEDCETTLSDLAPDALILPKRVNVMTLPSFKEGAFEIQDEASQLIAPLSQASASSKVLDACAGAGGKTLHFAALLQNQGEIYATDIDSRKLEELKKRVKRSGAQNVRIVAPDLVSSQLGKRKNGFFDVVLLDVPCTGTGTLRRNPGVKWVLTEEMLGELLEKQKFILEKNLKFVKPGGALLYATCSLFKSEGEGQILDFLERHSNFTLEEELRTRPDIQHCDGFYAARLRRNS